MKMTPAVLGCYLTLLVATKIVHTYPSRRFTPHSCLDIAHSQAEKPRDGFYQIFGKRFGDIFTVYCDFNSEARSAWTLVMSWSLDNNRAKSFMRQTLGCDAPVNENSPNWNAYRLPLSHMKALKLQSSHWRYTCSFPIHKVDYRDYLRANFHDFDLMTFIGGGICKKVEFINIRGNSGAQLTAAFWQGPNHAGINETLHTDSQANSCSFRAPAGAVFSEDNFGLYLYRNNNFRCTSNSSATTQLWFGGYY